MKNSAKVAFSVSSSLFLAGSALAATTAKSYIQDGLIAHWDAIENVGFGQHDNAATAWKDLKGSHDLTIVNSEATWEEAALYPPQKGYSAIAQDLGSPKLTKTSYRTMDVCASYYKAEKCVLGMGARNLSWYDKGFLIRNTTTKYCAADLTVNTPYSICINYAYNDSKPEGCWLDGEPIEESTSTAAFTPLSAADTTFEIGRSVNTYFSSCGRVHAVRLYNRPLETWEAWLNSNLDKVRYNGIDGTTLEWPEGYGFQDGDLCFRVTASVETYSTAESSDNRVAFNGGEAVPSLATWKTDGVACTLTPVPDANHRYCGWTGDTDDFTSDQYRSPSITVVGRVRTLRAEFRVEGTNVHTVPGEFSSLAAALASPLVMDGDTIQLADGTHAFAQEATVDGYTYLAKIDRFVTVRGSSPDNVVLDCDGDGGLYQHEEHDARSRARQLDCQQDHRGQRGRV